MKSDAAETPSTFALSLTKPASAEPSGVFENADYRPARFGLDDVLMALLFAGLVVWLF
jgi:hypothetical protein